MKISALFFSMMAAATLLAESKETKLAAEGPDHECTSWMIFSDLTGNNTNILHKNRDATARSIAVIEDYDYYYYVKAVPKINVTAPEMNVKRINAQRRKKSAPVRRER